MIRVRNLREGEAQSLSPELLDTGMLYLIPEWVWVVESDAHPEPFALIVASQAHSWLVLWRVLALSTPSPEIPLNWFLEALPLVFAEARMRGCVGFMALFADNRPQEVKLARIVSRLAKGGIMPFHGSIGAGMLAGFDEIERIQ